MLSEIPHSLWFGLAFVLFIAEMLTGTFFLFFFAVGALAVGLVKLTGALHDPVLELALFAVISLVALWIFPRRFLLAINPACAKRLQHEKIKIDQALKSGEEGKAFYQGAKWGVINTGKKTIPAGSEAVIVETLGVKLRLKHVSEVKTEEE